MNEIAKRKLDMMARDDVPKMVKSRYMADESTAKAKPRGTLPGVGDSIKESDIGSTLGSVAGGAIGSAIAPGVGTVIGGAVGGAVGDMAEDKLTNMDDIALSEQDMIRKPCKACGKGTKKAEMPDADEQQDVMQEASSNKEELPEDADEQQEENQGESSKEEVLPEDADEQQEEKQASARKKVRKLSVTNGGSAKYDGRENYNLSPMMRECVDRDFPGKQGGELAKSLNARLDEINKSKRNKSNTSVPMHVRDH